MTVTFKPTDYTMSPLERVIERANAVFDELHLSPTRSTVISTDTVEDDGEYGTTVAVVEHNRVANQTGEGPEPVLPAGYREPRNLITEFKIRFNRYPASELVAEFGGEGVIAIPIDAEQATDRASLAAALRVVTEYDFGARDFTIPIPHPTQSGQWIATFAGDHPYYVGSFIFMSDENLSQA